MTKTIDVFLNEDPYFTQVVTQLVTRSGQYYNHSIAARDIVEGRVFVNGTQVRKCEKILQPGLYTIQVGPNSYLTNLHHSAFE